MDEVSPEEVVIEIVRFVNAYIKHDTKWLYGVMIQSRICGFTCKEGTEKDGSILLIDNDFCDILHIITSNYDSIYDFFELSYNKVSINLEYKCPNDWTFSISFNFTEKAKLESVRMQSVLRSEQSESSKTRYSREIKLSDKSIEKVGKLVRKRIIKYRAENPV